MYTYEDRFRVHEIEFYVPSVSFEDVDFYAFELMMFRTFMMRSVTPIDDSYQLLGRDIARHQGVLVLDVAAPCMLIRTILQCPNDAIPNALKSHFVLNIRRCS